MSIRDDRLVWEGRYRRRHYLIINAEAYSWTLEDILRTNGLTVLQGSGALPRRLASTWAGHTATGERWHGREAGPGLILYVCDRPDIRAPLGFWFRTPASPAYLLCLPQSQMRRYPEQLRYALNELPTQPQLIVLDAFGDLLARGDNVPPTIAVPVCRDAMDLLREETEAAILLAQRRPRFGSPATFPGTDAIVELHRRRGRLILRNTMWLTVPPFGPIDLSADYAAWGLVSQ